MGNSPRRHYAGEVTVCDKCTEPIIFLAHERTTTITPITIASYPNGNIRELPGNKYAALGPANATAARAAGELLKLNHFANCSARDFFKARK